MVRLLLVLAAFGLVIGTTSLTNAGHHEAGEQADVAAPVDPSKAKGEADDAIEEASEAAKAAREDAAKKVEDPMEGDQLPAAPKPE